MSVYREKSRSCWMDVQPPRFPSLDENLKCDVAIIGSGIAGLSTAYELAKAGRTVAVLDRGPIGRGMTARTTAHIATVLDDFYHLYIAARGEEAARKLYAAQTAAADRIGAIVEEEGIACDHARLDGRWFLAGDLTAEAFDREWKALAAVGLSGVTKVEHINGHRLSDGPCIIAPGQGRFHPMKYLDGLAAVLKKMGVKLYADTCATKIEELKTVAHVEVDGKHRISAKAVVLATNSPINNDSKVTKREYPFRTYAFAAEARRGAIEDALYWDTERPYHYVRLQPAGEVDLLISGGEDHGSARGDEAERRFAELEAWTKERFPEMGRVRYRWSGQVLEPEDYVGFIGLSPGCKRTWIVTGDSGQGITHGVAASLILPALIDGGRHAWADVYDPAREPPENAEPREGKGKETEDEIASADGLSPGEGGILANGKAKLAVSRDEGGRLHQLSAKCTHLGCTVHWNSFEQCWDCPCHGSQFAPDGTALNAPAVKPLTPAGESASDKRAGEAIAR